MRDVILTHPAVPRLRREFSGTLGPEANPGLQAGKGGRGILHYPDHHGEVELPLRAGFFIQAGFDQQGTLGLFPQLPDLGDDR